MRSEFKGDFKKEGIVHEFLKTKFYINSAIERYTSVTDVEYQKLGVDVVLTSSKFGLTDIKIDEKTQTNYLGGGTSTFAFEISSNGNLGWILKPKLETTHFLFNWLRTKDRETLSSVEDIVRLEYCLISKESVRNMFVLHGINRQMVSEILDYSINDKSGVDKIPHFGNDSWWVTKSNNIYEKPINIVFKKNELISRSILHGFL